MKNENKEKNIVKIKDRKIKNNIQKKKKVKNIKVETKSDNKFSAASKVEAESNIAKKLSNKKPIEKKNLAKAEDTKRIELKKIEPIKLKKVLEKNKPSFSHNGFFEKNNTNKPNAQNSKNKDDIKMDKETALNNQRKTIEALSDANKMAVEVVKSISNLQMQFMRQSFEDFNAMVKEMTQVPMTPDMLKNQASRMKDSMSKAVEHSSDVTNILVKSNTDMYHKIQNHMTDSFEEMKYAAMGRKKS